MIPHRTRPSHRSGWKRALLAVALAGLFGVMLGFPVLRLRGDYLAIVTLGFGEIIRLVLLNWVDFTNGPAGIGSIPGPTLFGAVFAETAPEGKQTVADMLGIPFSSNQRLIFLYYVILGLALVTNLFTQRMRRLPVGRAWEALREDETACKALGINPTNTKLTAFAIGAMFAGFAGAFFATRQGFISPESFAFIESAVILAIVVLGGMGSQIGVVLAAVLLIGIPEFFRELAQFRMLAFGAREVACAVRRAAGGGRLQRGLAVRQPGARARAGGAGHPRLDPGDAGPRPSRAQPGAHLHRPRDGAPTAAPTTGQCSAKPSAAGTPICTPCNVSAMLMSPNCRPVILGAPFRTPICNPRESSDMFHTPIRSPNISLE